MTIYRRDGQGNLLVTTLDAVWVDRTEYAALHRAQQGGRLRTRIHAYAPLPDWKWAATELPRPVTGGTDMLVARGVKGFVDGSLGSTTAWFFEPYADAPRESGFPTTPPESLAVLIAAADSAGLQVVVHAIGDRANALLLGIYDSVAAAHGPRDRRFRDEHAQHLRATDIPRFAAIGVIPSMQPYHAADDGRWADKRIGSGRSRTTYAFRSLLDAGARLTFGSDWTVAPLDPLAGIHAAVTRQTLDGRNPGGWVPEQRITVEEALRAYTGGVAYGHFREQQEGMLRAGMLADLVLIDRDFTVVPTGIDQARVVATVVGGMVVYPTADNPAH
jgi:predicted amidohydrolase YtcJ